MRLGWKVVIGSLGVALVAGISGYLGAIALAETLITIAAIPFWIGVFLVFKTRPKRGPGSGKL